MTSESCSSAAAHVLLLPPYGGIADDLRHAGVGCVEGWDACEAAGSRLVVGPVSAALDPALVNGNGIGYLPVWHGPDELVLGPLLGPEQVACARCLLAALGDPPPEDSPGRLGTLHQGLLIREVMALTGRLPRPGTPTRAVRYHRGTRLVAAVPPQPSCTICLPGSAGADGGDALPLGVRFELAVADPPRRWTDPRQQPNLGRQRAQTPYRVRKDWPSARSLRLPEMPDGRQRGLRLDTVGVLLSRAAGYAGPAGPGAGTPIDNSRSAQIHMVARYVPGLADGCYGYQPARHALAVLGDASPAPDLPEVPAALLVFSGGLKGLFTTHKERALRLCALDAGAAIARLDAVAAPLRVQVGVLGDSQLRELPAELLDGLFIDPAIEPVTAAVMLT